MPKLLSHGMTSEMNRDQVLDVVVTARPSWARVKSLVENYVSALGGQSCRISLVGPAISDRYGDLNSNIDRALVINQFPTLQDSDDLDAVALTSLNGGASLAHFWRQSRPDAALIIADRTETLGVAVCAALMQIPLIHLQGGETTGSIDDKVRRANTKLADFHLTTNELTRNEILRTGEDPNRIKVIGCPSIDLVKEVKESNVQLNFLNLGGVGVEFGTSEKYGLIMFHPDTANEEENSYWVMALISMIQVSNLNWFWFWPNPDHGTNTISKLIRRFRERGELPRTRFIINLAPEVFISLAINSQILVGNSSFGIRESSYIGLPVLNIGKRQLGRQMDMNVQTVTELDQLKALWSIAQDMAGRRFAPSTLYGSGNSGELGSKAIREWHPSTKLKRH